MVKYLANHINVQGLIPVVFKFFHIILDFSTKVKAH